MATDSDGSGFFGGTDLAIVAVIAAITTAVLRPQEFRELLDGSLEPAFFLFLVFFGIWFVYSFVWLVIIRPLLEHAGIMEKSGR